jgi:DNA mismatch repair protein MutS
VFLRQVLPGGASKSYGLHVARLAGLPAEVLTEAARVLMYLEKQGATPVADTAAATNGTGVTSAGLATLVHDLLRLDLCTITPLHALTLLHDLQQQARALRRDKGGGA